MTKRDVYLRQIERLQEQNRLLAEVIATERKLRKEAYAWYFHRLHSRWWGIIDLMLLSKTVAWPEITRSTRRRRKR